MPGGQLHRLMVIGLGLPATFGPVVMHSLRSAVHEMKADPEWDNIRSPEDAMNLLRRYIV